MEIPALFTRTSICPPSVTAAAMVLRTEASSSTSVPVTRLTAITIVLLWLTSRSSYPAEPLVYTSARFKASSAAGRLPLALAARVEAGQVVNFKRRDGCALSGYLPNYIAKPPIGLTVNISLIPVLVAILLLLTVNTKGANI
jgi:hypothetical protein